MSANKLVTCPYDEVHKVKESRLQLHITKCRQNHLSEEKFICPFNAVHVLPRQERDFHLMNCPDRAALDRKLAQNLDKNNPSKGRTAVPSYAESIPLPIDEVWDSDYTSATPGYVPPSQPPTGAIVEPPPMSKPAERRKLYQELHRLPSEADKSAASSSIRAPVTPRQPKQPSEASRRQIQNTEDCQGLGLGRGRGAPVSRIAANFYPPQSISNNNKQNDFSYSAAITSGLSNLGLGRGQVSAPAIPPPSFCEDDDEFPALGFGRGINRNPPARNGIKAPGSRN